MYHNRYGYSSTIFWQTPYTWEYTLNNEFNSALCVLFFWKQYQGITQDGHLSPPNAEMFSKAYKQNPQPQSSSCGQSMLWWWLIWEILRTLVNKGFTLYIICSELGLKLMQWHENCICFLLLEGLVSTSSETYNDRLFTCYNSANI